MADHVRLSSEPFAPAAQVDRIIGAIDAWPAPDPAGPDAPPG